MTSEKRKHFCAALEFGFACSHKSMGVERSHSGTILESVIQWFLSSLQYLLFLQYVFTLTAGKRPTAHQIIILEIQKAVEILCDLELLIFVKN
jgi:hypothetical protein